MALTTCPECGAQVSDQASSCPKCGVPLSRVIKCPECGNVVSDHDLTCPSCGFALKQINTTANRTYGDTLVELPTWYKILSYILVGLIATTSIISLMEGTANISLLFAILRIAVILLFVIKKERKYFLALFVVFIVSGIVVSLDVEDGFARFLLGLILTAILIIPILLKNSEGKSIYSSLK